MTKSKIHGLLLSDLGELGALDMLIEGAGAECEKGVKNEAKPRYGSHDQEHGAIAVCTHARG